MNRRIRRMLPQTITQRPLKNSQRRFQFTLVNCQRNVIVSKHKNSNVQQWTLEPRYQLFYFSYSERCGLAKRLVTEVAATGKDHRQTEFVTRVDNFLITLGTSRLDNSRNPLRRLNAVGKREKRV